MDPNLEAQLRKRTRDKRKEKRAAKLVEEGGGLNMNSMMDMMTIILVFLLKSYGEEPLQVGANTDLPFSTSESKPVATMAITIARDAIFVNTDRLDFSLEDQRVPIGELQGSRKDSSISKMSQVLEKAVRTRRDVFKENDPEGIRATIIADASIPYLTLSQVIQTSVNADVKRFRFLVYKGNMQLSGTVQVKQ